MFEIQKRSFRQLAAEKPTYLFNTIIAAMGYAKNIGRSPGDFVRFFMERQEGWQSLRGDLEGVFQAFVTNFQQHTEMVDDEFVVILTENGVSLATAPIEELFKDEVSRWGLTPAEVREGWKVSAGMIGDYTGFRIAYDMFDGKNWIHIRRTETGSDKKRDN